MTAANFVEHNQPALVLPEKQNRLDQLFAILSSFEIEIERPRVRVGNRARQGGFSNLPWPDDRHRRL